MKNIIFSIHLISNEELHLTRLFLQKLTSFANDKMQNDTYAICLSLQLISYKIIYTIPFKVQFVLNKMYMFLLRYIFYSIM